MKNLAKLNGAKALSKNEQKSINGGDGLILSPLTGCILQFIGNRDRCHGGRSWINGACYWCK